jgi:glycosyltransferase involved in cell wall biosynthesis
MIKVLADGTVFENTYQRGIRRYLEELLRRVSEPFSVMLHQPAASPLPPGWHTIGPLGAGPASSCDLVGRWRYRQHARDWHKRLADHQVYHSSYFRPCPVRGMPTVVVVHDMVCEIMPHYFWGDAAGEAMKKRVALDQATAVIAISEATKRDLLMLYPDLKSRVCVIHDGTDHLATSGTDIEPARIADEHVPYALFVGDRAGYKNFAGLMEAMMDPAWPVGLVLRLVGPQFSKAEEMALRYRGLDRRVYHCGRLGDEALAALYREASVFVFPTLCEGFGFPLLEAQAQGVPVAASDIAVFREVGGAGFQRFQPLDPHSLATAVAATLAPGLATALSNTGRENVRRFRWDETALRTQAVWDACANGTPLAGT